LGLLRDVGGTGVAPGHDSVCQQLRTIY
jgi:hypothetical protein